jgi:4-methyl-5(b-hydroxyethyl)-thiazole monophosphate biosynthesis
MKKAIVFLAEGFEEVEALTPVDYLRRVGIEVVTVAISKSETAGNLVKGSHAIQVVADTSLSDLAKDGKLVPALWDAAILPGGMPGSANLAACKELGAFLKEMAGPGKCVCAICAAPALVLAPLGLLENRRFTCYPGMEEKVSNAKWSKKRVVIDENAKGCIITSRGAGTAGEFAVMIIGRLMSEAEGKQLAEKVILT